MNKKITIFFVCICTLALAFSVFQYVREFQSEFASAYTATKPANGHSWAEMECSSGLCVTSGNNVGIGTDNPTKKLFVVGDIGATGDVCNGTGNCLSALATLTNACGGAATNYVYSATAYSGTYCVMGVSTPASPTFPSAGNSTTWTCPVTSGSPISCTATHAAAPVAGVCGTAATTYAYSATAYSGTYCSTGTASPTNPAFPGVGSSTTWSCLGTNGGASPSCTASRSTPPNLVGGAHTELNCTAAGGTVVSSGATYNQCQFALSACPSGWTQWAGWSDTTSQYCCFCTGECGMYPNCGCTTGGHGWANSGRETCEADTCAGPHNTCYSTVNKIGCY